MHLRWQAFCFKNFDHFSRQKRTKCHLCASYICVCVMLRCIIYQCIWHPCRPRSRRPLRSLTLPGMTMTCPPGGQSIKKIGSSGGRRDVGLTHAIHAMYTWSQLFLMNKIAISLDQIHIVSVCNNQHLYMFDFSDFRTHRGVEFGAWEPWLYLYPRGPSKILPAGPINLNPHP